MKRIVLIILAFTLFGCSGEMEVVTEPITTYKVVTIDNKESSGLEEPYMTLMVLVASIGSHAKVEVDPINKILVIQPKGDWEITSDENAVDFFESIESIATDEIFSAYKFAILESSYDLESNNYEFSDDELTTIYQNGEILKSTIE